MNEPRRQPITLHAPSGMVLVFSLLMVVLNLSDGMSAGGWRDWVLGGLLGLALNALGYALLSRPIKAAPGRNISSDKRSLMILAQFVVSAAAWVHVATTGIDITGGANMAEVGPLDTLAKIIAYGCASALVGSLLYDTFGRPHHGEGHSLLGLHMTKDPVARTFSIVRMTSACTASVFVSMAFMGQTLAKNNPSHDHLNPLGLLGLLMSVAGLGGTAILTPSFIAAWMAFQMGRAREQVFAFIATALVLWLASIASFISMLSGGELKSATMVGLIGGACLLVAWVSLYVMVMLVRDGVERRQQANEPAGLSEDDTK